MFEIQLEKSKSAKLNTRKNFKPHGIAMSLDKGIENVFVFLAISMHLHPDFNNPALPHCINFSCKKVDKITLTHLTPRLSRNC